MLVLAIAVAAVAAVRGMWSPCGLSMLSSLNPMAERARGHRPLLTAAWYVAGALSGGAVLGLGYALAALGVRPLHWAGTTVFAIAAGCAVVAVLSDTRVLGWSLPDHPRQVNERWLTSYRRWIYAAGFGAQIGVGFATYIMSAALYLSAALAVLSGPAGALLTGLSFGLVRGLCVLCSAGASTADRLRALLRGVEALGAISLRVVIAVEIVVAIMAGYEAGGLLVAAALTVGLLAVVALAVVPRRGRTAPLGRQDLPAR